MCTAKSIYIDSHFFNISRWRPCVIDIDSRTFQDGDSASWFIYDAKVDKIICNFHYYASNFASKVEKHGISQKKSYLRFFVEFHERKSTLF